MAITNHGELKAAIADWLDRTDMASRIPDLVVLARATLNKVLRSTRMVGQATVALTAGQRHAAAPADMIDPIFLTAAGDEDYPLEQVSAEDISRLRRGRMRSAGQPRYFAVVGRRFELAPTPAVSGSLELSYYQEIPALAGDSATNWVLTYEPDIYLYTSLLHGAHFLQDANRALLLENLLTKQIVSAVGAAQTVQLDSGGG